jgi:molybdopterin molybdotransferase
MISIDEALSRLLALVTPLPCETVPLTDAIGRWASEPIIAKRTQPARDLSAMDGYALAANGAVPSWDVVGESSAGSPYRGSIMAGQAVRIFTGAALPTGADRVIMQEDAARDGNVISATSANRIEPGHHVRRSGSDFRSGDTLIEAGERLTPARIALAVSGGHAELPVRRRVQVEVLSTGNELVAPGEDAGDDLLPESNALMVGLMLRDFRCSVVSPGIIPDDLELLTGAIRQANESADVIVTTGGASVGDHDLVRPALEACGATLDFWKVAMRPGKPMFAGKLGRSIILGLPGNPVSAYVTAELFLKPLIAALGGATTPSPRRELAILHGDLPAVGPRTDHIRAVRNLGLVVPVGVNDSAALRALAKADTLIVRPAHSAPAKSGDTIEIILLS